jgi:YjjG family noncanonical pyrimidine nucleotidase
MPVSFVYFDIDDTLLDHSHAEREALGDLRERYLEVFGTLSIDELQERYHAINSPLWRRYADGEIEKETLQRERFERLLADVGAGHADAAQVRSRYMERYAAHWRFVPGARDAFEEVAARYPVGVLTNGFLEVQERKLERFPVLRERSEAVVVSEETGALKPHPDVFAHATEQAGVSAEDVLYVGDSYRSDVEGGRRAGWRVAWFVRNGQEAPDDQRPDAGFAFRDWDALTQRL